MLRLLWHMRDPVSIDRTRIFVQLNKGIRWKSWTRFCPSDPLRSATNSVAVSMEYILFLRKQVIGGCNGLAEKAKIVRWQPSGSLPEHTSQKTYILEVVPPQADGFQAMGRRWFSNCRFVFLKMSRKQVMILARPKSPCFFRWTKKPLTSSFRFVNDHGRADITILIF